MGQTVNYKSRDVLASMEILQLASKDLWHSTPHIVSKGLSTPERKLIKLEKSPNKTLKTGKKMKKK